MKQGGLKQIEGLDPGAAGHYAPFHEFLLPPVDWTMLDSNRPADFLVTQREFKACKTREAAYSLLFAAHLKLRSLASQAGLFEKDSVQWKAFFDDFNRLNCDPLKVEPAAGTPPYQFKADLKRGLKTLAAILAQNVLPALRGRPMPAVRKADIVDVNVGTKTLIEETYALEVVDEEGEAAYDLEIVEEDVSDAATDITPRPVLAPSVIAVGGSFAVPRVRTPDHLQPFGAARLTPAPDKGPALLSDEDMNGAEESPPRIGPASIVLAEHGGQALTGSSLLDSEPKIVHSEAQLNLAMAGEQPENKTMIEENNPFDPEAVTDVSGRRPEDLGAASQPTRPFDTTGMESAMEDGTLANQRKRPSFWERLTTAAGHPLATAAIIGTAVAAVLAAAQYKPTPAPAAVKVAPAAAAQEAPAPNANPQSAAVFTPLWTQVRQTVPDDKTAAEVTNALVDGQYSTHSWETVQQAHPWKTDGRALKAAVGHLESWGGYQAPLDSWKLCVSHGVTPTLDNLMTCLEDDHARYGKDSGEVAYRVAAQVSMMNDKAIYDDLKEVEARHTTLANRAALAFERGTVTGQIEAPQGGERLGQLDSAPHADALAHVQWKDTLNKLADEMEGDISELHRWARGKNRAAIGPFMEDFVAGVRKTAALGNGSPEELRSRTLALKDKLELKGFERRGTLATYLQRASAKIMKGLDASIAPLYAETVDSQQERAQEAVKATLPEESGFTAEEEAWFA